MSVCPPPPPETMRREVLPCPLARRSAVRAVRPLALAWLALLAACSAVPDPSLGCTDDAQCQNGRCVNGVCVADLKADSAGGNDGQIADAGPDVVIACTSTEQCQEAWAKLSACVTPTCTNGQCSAQPMPDQATCTTIGLCPAYGRCNVGNCLAESAPCDDNNPCTADQCLPTGCNHVAFGGGINCTDDGKPCTDDLCKLGNCVHPLRQGRCLVDGICANDGERAFAVGCEQCDATKPDQWQLAASGGCIDDDPCTGDEVCNSSGACVGQPILCDDGNPCTDDSCDGALGCVQLPNTATCTDDDPCTSGDGCVGGTCAHTSALECDDQNPCTLDTCNSALGCSSIPTEGTCLADADPCTDDVCIAGKCVGVPSVTVCQIGSICVPGGVTSDANPCLICAPNVDATTWTVLDGVGCDDGNACTTLDTCKNGGCFGALVECNDGSGCTYDSCDPFAGCVYAPITGACDDGSACTTNDTCVQGQCKGTIVGPADCLDGNPCTTDWCDDVAGCTHAPNSGPCDDNDPCTKNDFCNTAACLPGYIVCPCEFHSDCDDSNSCTLDVCVIGDGCSNTAIGGGKACDDSDPCTGNDTCNGAICSGVPLLCDDNNPCTADVCLAELGCIHKPLQGIVCDDDSKCTKADVCVDGSCVGVPLLCDDGNDCTTDSCAPAQGKCKATPREDGAPCVTDGIPCTLDICLNAKCTHSLVASGFCLIDGACISGGASHPAKACFGCLPAASPTGWSLLVGAACDDGNACTVNTACTVSGACVGPPWDCDDNDACTLDACSPQAIGKDPCLHVSKSGACDDGNACTTSDVCKNGVCQGTSTVCEDDNPCTLDACSPSSGCFATQVADGTACTNDDIACTLDICEDGGCTHPLAADACWIGGTCVNAGQAAPGAPCTSCQPKVSTKAWSPATGPNCDDGDPCTGGDACSNGVCVGDPTKACDDNNPCTSDSCSPTTGCAHAAVSGPCSDGNPCTVGETCTGGECLGGAPVVCAQPANGDCKVATCVPATGGCTLVSSCTALHSCVEGLCVTAQAGTAGPVEVPLPNASQPLRPTLAWQESFVGPSGAIPQLWLAAQDRGCKPDLGLSSSVVLARLAAGEAAPSITTIAGSPPPATTAWCAAQPVLSAHPNGFDALLLTWLEGGATGSSCAFESAGGAIRIGLVGQGGGKLVTQVAAPCPVGATTPLPWRPEALATSALAGSSGEISLNQLSGVLLRASVGGGLAWQGSALVAWGGAKGSAAPSVTMPGLIEVNVAARSSIVPWLTGHVALTPARYLGASGGVAALLAWSIDASGKPAATRQVVVTGAGIGGDISYAAVDSALDTQAGKLGVLVSGLSTDAGKTRAFLAFARIQPQQAAMVNPPVVHVSDLPAGVPVRPLDAFRLTQLPGTGAFLAVWVQPGGAVLQGARIAPTSDSSFQLTALGALAANFAGHAIDAGADAFGGLSELVIDPTGTRFSLAWEGTGSLWLLTSPLPTVAP